MDMTREEAERFIQGFREEAAAHGFCNRNIPGDRVIALLTAFDVVCGHKREHHGTPTRPAQPGRPRLL